MGRVRALLAFEAAPPTEACEPSDRRTWLCRHSDPSLRRRTSSASGRSERQPAATWRSVLVPRSPSGRREPSPDRPRAPSSAIGRPDRPSRRPTRADAVRRGDRGPPGAPEASNRLPVRGCCRRRRVRARAARSGLGPPCRPSGRRPSGCRAGGSRASPAISPAARGCAAAPAARGFSRPASRGIAWIGSGPSLVSSCRADRTRERIHRPPRRSWTRTRGDCPSACVPLAGHRCDPRTVPFPSQARIGSASEAAGRRQDFGGAGFSPRAPAAVRSSLGIVANPSAFLGGRGSGSRGPGVAASDLAVVMPARAPSDPSLGISPASASVAAPGGGRGADALCHPQRESLLPPFANRPRFSSCFHPTTPAKRRRAPGAWTNALPSG